MRRLFTAFVACVMLATTVFATPNAPAPVSDGALADTSAFAVDDDSGFVSENDQMRLFSSDESAQSGSVSDSKSAQMVFSDVSQSNWFYEAVEYVVSHGLMQGETPSEFMPAAEMTRASVVSALHNLAGNPRPSAIAEFTDMPPTSWYAVAVSWAQEQEIVTGYANGAFGASDPVTREQFVLMLRRYAEVASVNSEADVACLEQFSDSADIGGWARASVAWACTNGLVTGASGNTFEPKSVITRAQAAAVLMRFCEKYELLPGEPGSELDSEVKPESGQGGVEYAPVVPPKAFGGVHDLPMFSDGVGYSRYTYFTNSATSVMLGSKRTAPIPAFSPSRVYSAGEALRLIVWFSMNFEMLSPEILSILSADQDFVIVTECLGAKWAGDVYVQSVLINDNTQTINASVGIWNETREDSGEFSDYCYAIHVVPVPAYRYRNYDVVVKRDVSNPMSLS